MKNFPMIIAVCMGIIGVIVAGVFVYESMVSAPKAAEQKSILNQYAVPAYSDTEKKAPSTGFGKSNKDPEIQNLMNDVNTATDDAGASDIQTLKTDVSGL